MAEITSIERLEKSFRVIWSDNVKSHYNFLWLRDNCSTAKDTNTNHRMFNLLDLPDHFHPNNYALDQVNKILTVTWNHEGHQSKYSYEWLREKCYTLRSNKKYLSPYELWDQKLEINAIKIEFQEIMDSDEGLKKWLDLLYIKGIAIVKNCPTEKESAFPLLRRISHTRETFFKTPFDVISLAKPNNSAYTALGLRNHTDLPYFESPPGYQFLHCLINSANGGESVASDGYAVAKYMKDNYPNAYKVLTKVPVKFIDQDYTQNTKRVFHAPEISIDQNGEFKDIRYSIATMAIMDCPPEVMDEFYDAHQLFGRFLHSNQFCLNFKMGAGDLFSFNNRRVLHGRKAFDMNSGNRHLQGYYIDRDEIESRLNFLNNIDIS